MWTAGAFSAVYLEQVCNKTVPFLMLFESAAFGFSDPHTCERTCAPFPSWKCKGHVSWQFGFITDHVCACLSKAVLVAPQHHPPGVPLVPLHGRSQFHSRVHPDHDHGVQCVKSSPSHHPTRLTHLLFHAGGDIFTANGCSYLLQMNSSHPFPVQLVFLFGMHSFSLFWLILPEDEYELPANELFWDFDGRICQKSVNLRRLPAFFSVFLRRVLSCGNAWDPSSGRLTCCYVEGLGLCLLEWLVACVWILR